MTNLELVNKFMTDNGCVKRTEYPDGFKGFRGYYRNDKFMGTTIDAAFPLVLDLFLDSWDEDNASESEIDYINSICDLRRIKSFSSADDKPSFV
jgi:hypothetical protein